MTMLYPNPCYNKVCYKGNTLQFHAVSELLHFQPIHCEGQIETWLTSFLLGLKSGLQFQLATAMGVEKMPIKSRQIRSAGSRKVTLPAKVSSSTEKLNKKGRYPIRSLL